MRASPPSLFSSKQMDADHMANLTMDFNVSPQIRIVDGLQHLLATFRTQKIDKLTIDLDAEMSKLRVIVVGDNGIIKTYDLDCTNSEVLHATVDKDSYPTQVIAEASELNKILSSFQSTLDEITIIANPEHRASASSIHRACQMQSFYDPEKGVEKGLGETL